jgi:hypothetical protein
MLKSTKKEKNANTKTHFKLGVVGRRSEAFRNVPNVTVENGGV